MKRLVFLVEGDTEVIFINQHVIPYLYLKGYTNRSIHVQKIITNRKMHKKGGVINYQYLKNDINNLLSQGNIIITTLVDFFRLPTNFPGYTTDAKQINQIELSMHLDFKNNPFIIPYIQKHEMEALMFSGMSGFEIVVDEEKDLAKLKAIIDEYADPEEINSNPLTAPSKRLESIFSYDKIIDGEMILEGLGIDMIISKCPRFKQWLEKIENLLKDH
jgi:hypothetical protein